MKSLKNYILAGITLAGILHNSCKKLVDVGVPKTQLVATTVFKDSIDANSAIVGIYVSMSQVGGFGICSGGMTLYPGLSADEMLLNASDLVTNQFYNNQILP